MKQVMERARFSRAAQSFPPTIRKVPVGNNAGLELIAVRLAQQIKTGIRQHFDAMLIVGYINIEKLFEHL